MFTKYEKSAEVDIEEVCKYVKSAEEEAEAVYTVKNGAEQEVWSAIKWLEELSNDIEVGMLSVTEGGLQMELYKFMDGSEGSLAGGGTIVFELDGEWTDPVIEFDWEGEMFRYNAAGDTWYTASAGSVSLYTVKADGTTNTVSAVSSIGNTASGADGDYTEEQSGTYSTQLSGTYTKLGLSIKFSGWSGTYYRADSELVISNVKFDGKKIGFPESSEFDKLVW